MDSKNNETESQIDFPTYFTTGKNDDDEYLVLRVSSDLEDAKKWVEQQSATHDTSADEEKETNDQPEIEGVSGEANASATEDEPGPDGFEQQLTSFVLSIRSVYDLINLNAPIRVIFPKVFMDRYFRPLEEDLPAIYHHKNLKIFGVPEEKLSYLNSKIKDLEHINDGISTIPANVLMGLVARFDASISGLVRFLLTSRTAQLGRKDRTIPVRDVLTASSFDELIAKLVDDEIHSIMHGSHESQIRYIEENFDIKARSGFERWSAFIEVFERRNLVAHGEKRANSRYDRNCSSAKVQENDRIPLNKAVSLTDQYLRSSTDILLEFGVLLIWWLWLKHDPKSEQLAYSVINSVTYDLILEKRYKLSARILASALSRQSKAETEVARRMMTVNHANCLKKTGNTAEYEESLGSFQWAASADEFKISVASLREDVEEVCALMPRVQNDETVGKSGFREWPVFDWVRDKKEFKERFREVFGEPITVANPSHEPARDEEQESGQSGTSPGAA